MKVIGQAHALVHQKGVLRVQSSMRVGTRGVFFFFPPAIFHPRDHRPGDDDVDGLERNPKNGLTKSHSPPTRTDKAQTASDKVKRVQAILAEDEK